MVFVVLIVTPFTLYLYALHPAWTWMYMLDPSKLHWLALIPLYVLHGGVVVLGWMGGARLIRVGRPKLALSGAVGLAAFAALLVVPLWGRLGRYGTYVEHQDNRALPIMEVKLGYVLVMLAFGLFVSALFVGVELSRDSHRVRSL